MKVIERGNEVLDKEMDVLDLLNTVRQIKTYIQKNHLDWKKLKDVVPKNEAKRVLRTGDDDGKIHYRVKNKKSGKSEEVKELERKLDRKISKSHLSIL